MEDYVQQSSRINNFISLYSLLQNNVLLICDSTLFHALGTEAMMLAERKLSSIARQRLNRE